MFSARARPAHDRPAIEVSAGVIFRQGKLLITQRHAGSHLGGLWECPGGKREPPETFEECLHRELREELGIEVRILDLLDSLTHQYPEKAVHLRFFHCQWFEHEPRAIGCPEFRWVTAGEQDRYQFPAADARLLEKLRLTRELWV
jgi:mutator protein MutT